MPTANRRLHVTLTPELSKVMERLWRATGTPMAAMVRDLLLEALPVLQGMVDALEMAKTKPREAVDAMTNHVLRVVGRASSEVEAAREHQRALPLPQPKQRRKRRRRTG